mgnify:CR=1 FL=1
MMFFLPNRYFVTASFSILKYRIYVKALCTLKG